MEWLASAFLHWHLPEQQSSPAPHTGECLFQRITVKLGFRRREACLGRRSFHWQPLVRAFMWALQMTESFVHLTREISGQAEGSLATMSLLSFRTDRNFFQGPILREYASLLTAARIGPLQILLTPTLPLPVSRRMIQLCL